MNETDMDLEVPDYIRNEATCMIEVEEENVNKMKGKLQKLYSIWKDMGIDETRKIDRGNVVWAHMLNLLQEMVDEENGYYENILERIKNYKKKILELSNQLCMPEDVEVEERLIKAEEILRQKLDKLSKVKEKRSKTYQDLRSLESKYCRILGLPTLQLSSITGVPSEKDLHELEMCVKMMEEEREQRLRKFCLVKKELTTILEVTELTPDTPLEKEILINIEDDDTISLSKETFQILDQIVTKLQTKKADLEIEKKNLIKKLTVLWERLEIPESERQSFLLKHSDCRVSTLNSIKEEIERCEEIKKQNIKIYVDNLRREILDLWTKCFVSELERKNFEAMYSEIFNEETLEVHDTETEKWRKHYENCKHIIEKINKRQELWDLLGAFETKAADPNRFKNRGGKLLQEERERKKLQKDLPALENEIFVAIDNYEAEKGEPFLYYGQDFRTFVTEQWEQRLNQKENEKIMRHKQRVMQNEITLTTPDRKRLISCTPKSAPSKLFKSSVGLAIYRTPSVTSRRVIPSTVGRLKIKNQQSETQKFLNEKQYTLRERNEPSTSVTLNATTYTEFAEQLNRSSKSGFRSSVLSSRKVVGTRTSSSRSKRKSNSRNKSMHKTLRKKTDTSKLTPARGKLGLPFLI